MAYSLSNKCAKKILVNGQYSSSTCHRKT